MASKAKPVFNSPLIESSYRSMIKAGKEFLISEYHRHNRICDSKEVKRMTTDQLAVECLCFDYGRTAVEMSLV